MEKNKKNYCPYVESGLRLNFSVKNGEVFARYKPCCNLNSDLISKEMKENISINSINEVYDGTVRKQWIKYFNENAGLHPACIQCADSESAGLPSARTQGKLSFDYNKYDVFRVDITLSTECNLACTFCSPGASSLIEKVASNHNPNNLPEQWEIKNIDVQPDSKTTSNLISDFLQQHRVQYVKFIGGEPLLHNNWSPIADVIDKRCLEETTLELTTNGTILNERVLNNLSKVKNVKLRISVDSIGNNYDFLRWPHNFDKIDSNLRFLKQNQPDNFDSRIAVLVNIYNLEFIPDIEAYFRDLELPVNFTYNLKPVNAIQHYLNAPNSIRQHVLNNCTHKTNRAMLSNTICTDNIRSYEDIIAETKWFLKQRNMPSDVFGPMTREWLNL